MNKRTFIFAIASMLACSSLLLGQEQPQERPTHTTISVEKMCCDGCAQKIAARLYTVRGVKEVRINLEKKLVFVIPQENQTLSPRAMWIAVEKGEDQPIVLTGPSGTYKKKPGVASNLVNR